MNKTEILLSEIVTDIPRGENNPRNSEGDFAVLDDGRILFAYSRYTGDDADDNASCDIGGMISDDGGKTFTHLPYLLAKASDHGVRNIMSVSLHRLGDGTLCLFYLCKTSPQSEYYLRRAAGDGTRFGEPELIIPQRDGVYYVVNNCRVCTLPDGSTLVPAAVHKVVKHDDGTELGEYFGKFSVFSCDKNGKNSRIVCEDIEMPNPGHSETGLQEPGLAVLPDGRLYCYTRTDRCFQYECFSSDNGETWTVPVPSRFTAPESPMLIVKCPYGKKYYAVWNPIPEYNGRFSDKDGRWVNAGRTPLVLAQSDNGIDFSDHIAIEDCPSHGYCYPAICFLNEKEFLMSYCCGGDEDGMCLTRTRIRRIVLK